MKNDISEKTGDVVNNFMQMLANRDLEGIVSLFANKVDWYIPGEQRIAPWVGKRSTREEIREFYKLLWESTKPLGANIECMMVRNNQAVMTGEFSTLMLETGGVFKSLFSIQITVEDDLIVFYRLLEDSNELVRVLTRKDRAHGS